MDIATLTARQATPISLFWSARLSLNHSESQSPMASILPPYRPPKDIVEMLQAMDKLCPGVPSRHTLLYGVEVKFYSCRLQLNKSMETEIPGMFAIGDGAGVSRGLVQASASGGIGAQEILRRIKPGSQLHHDNHPHE